MKQPLHQQLRNIKCLNENSTSSFISNTRPSFATTSFESKLTIVLNKDFFQICFKENSVKKCSAKTVFTANHQSWQKINGILVLEWRKCSCFKSFWLIFEESSFKASCKQSYRHKFTYTYTLSSSTINTIKLHKRNALYLYLYS